MKKGYENPKMDYFSELGIKSFINAAAPYSSLGGAQMWPEVIQAMNYASTRRARMKELHDVIGKRIASLIGCDAAMVSAGATSAMTLGTAACMTGRNEDFIHRLPDTKGMRDEVIIQKSHRYSYEHAVRNCGAKIVEVETGNDVKKALTKKTAMMLFYYGREPEGQIKAEEFVAIGGRHKIPTFCDGATTVPPVENMFKLVKYGFDLICFSGGKGLRGPYSAGLLLGRKDLIEAARLNASPNDDTIGRGMKVSKEEILGMMVAVEVSLKHDYKAEWQKKKKWLKLIADEATSIPAIKAEIFMPEVAEHHPHLRLKWDESTIKLSPSDVVRQLREGNPSIEVCSFSLTGGKFELSPWEMQPGEAEKIGRRLREIFTSKSLERRTVC
ncbi:MAG: selenocysteine synthase [Candidatus Aminicenantes bacterium]|nr:MAG: selenocysteine synthase [Candidatus Aminicenantes bacterium]